MLCLTEVGVLRDKGRYSLDEVMADARAAARVLFPSSSDEVMADARAAARVLFPSSRSFL
jgi:hypothetical protein